MITVKNSFYKDYENLLIKNDELSEEVRKLKYYKKLTDEQLKDLAEKERKMLETLKEKEIEHEKLLREKEYEIARLKALLNIDGTNHGIPTSMTPIHKKKVIPNTREKSNKAKGRSGWT